MKTSDSPVKKSKFSFFWLGILKFISQKFLCLTATSKELQVSPKIDRRGHKYWQAYDPKTGDSTSLSSEAEMRVWIEQRYYQSN